MNGKKGTFNLTINVTANEDYDERSASIIIACDDIRRTIDFSGLKEKEEAQ